MSGGNVGPVREVWRCGDRVRDAIVPMRGRRSTVRGTVGPPQRDPNAGETECVWVNWVNWVNWDDGQAGYDDPNCLDTA